MADNYLEKQMEQYQARKAAWEKELKLGKKKPKHTTSSPKSAAQSPASTPDKKIE